MSDVSDIPVNSSDIVNPVPFIVSSLRVNSTIFSVPCWKLYSEIIWAVVPEDAPIIFLPTISAGTAPGLSEVQRIIIGTAQLPSLDLIIYFSG